MLQTKEQEWSEVFIVGFPGGSMVKNLPANTGDMGLIHDPGRSHMPQSI